MKRMMMVIALIGLLGNSQILAQESGSIGNGKKLGIAVNPVAALFEYGSGEINLWNVNRNAEINIPIIFAKNPFLDDEDTDGIDITLFSTGLNYRQFFSERQEGLFAQVGWQYMRAGISDDSNTSTSGSVNSILFGVGYRNIADNGLFWGFGISAGRGWGSISEPNGDSYRGSGFVMDIDLMKFGFAW